MKSFATVSMVAVALLAFALAAAAAPGSAPHISDHGDSEKVPGGTTILIVGDSISAGLGIQREDGWVHLLDQKLSALDTSIRVVNASVSGDTTQAGAVRLPRAMDTHDPDIVILELGGNDGLRGYPVANIRTNLIAMATSAESRGAKVVIVGMEIPPNYGPRYTTAFRNVFAEVSETTNTAFVPFLLDGVATDPELMQQDGIHPKAAAQPILLENVWRVLEPILARG